LKAKLPVDVTATTITDNKLNNTIEKYILPYRSRINKDLDSVLAYCPITLDKAINLQSTMGNMMADVVLEYGNKVFKEKVKLFRFVFLTMAV
jgi:hypothetical protein